MSFNTHNSLPFTSTINISDGARAIIARNQARAQKFLAGIQPHSPNAHKLTELRHRVAHHAHAHHGHKDVSPRDTTGDTIDVTDAAVTYTASVGVGSPATEYTLFIDIGSSNTWVGAEKKYKKTSTSKNTRKSVSVSYGSGSFSGTECACCLSLAFGATPMQQHLIVLPDTDQVTLSPSLIIESQSIGVASTAQGFSGVDGILGIGPVDLTEGTIGENTPVLTITDNLIKQSTISTESIGIFYQPSTPSSAGPNSKLTIGRVDSSKITGDVNFVPITSTSPASAFWGINQDITYGSRGESILSSTAGILDMGTTLVLIATGWASLLNNFKCWIRRLT